MTNTTKLALLAGLSAAAVAAPSQAQTAKATLPAAPATAGQDSAEIVVTAQKRAQKLIDVPVSITVVNAQQLSEQKIYNVADLARTSPSLEIVQAFGGPGGGGQIRGVGTTSFTRSAEGAVGVVVDGVPQGNVPNLSIYDLAQVEVLKGPQGTLFGLTSSAGVINMTTVAPDPRRASGYVHVDYSPTDSAGSEFGQETVRTAVNVPLGSKTALRVSGNYNRVEGVQRNAFNNTNNVLRDWSVRGRLMSHLGEAVTINLIADYDHRNQNYGDPQFVYVDVPTGTPLATQLASCGIVASYDNNARCAALPNYTRNRNWGVSGQIDVDLGAGTLTSITGLRKNKQLPSATDISANPGDFTQIFSDGVVTTGRQFSEELRFTSAPHQAFEYTAGLFYSDYVGTTSYANGGAFHLGTFQLAPFFIPFFQDNSSTRTTNRGYAAFGQATYHVTDKLGIIAGLRYTHQKLTDAQSANTLVGAPPTSGRLTKSNLSGKVGVQYAANAAFHVYATVTRGYKGPQITPATAGVPATVIGAEIPTAYELGAKGNFIGGRVGYDVSLFLTKVKNFQGQRCVINSVGFLSCVGDSVPSVTTKGFEIGLFGRPTRNLNLNAGFIYNVAKYPSGYTGYNPNDLRTPVAGTSIGITDLGGKQLIGSPRGKFVLNADYSVPVGIADLFVGGDVVHKSSIRLGYSGDPRFVYPAHWTVGLRAGVRDHNSNWSLEAFVRNLTQNREPATIFGGPSFIPPGAVPFIPNGTVTGISGWTTQASRRQVGLSAEYRF